MTETDPCTLLCHALPFVSSPRLTRQIYQNPTGTSMSAENGMRLVELAHRYGFYLLSDEPCVYPPWRFAGVGAESIVWHAPRVCFSVLTRLLVSL